MRTRLFHAVVVVGGSLVAACGGRSDLDDGAMASTGPARVDAGSGVRADGGVAVDARVDVSVRPSVDAVAPVDARSAVDAPVFVDAHVAVDSSVSGESGVVDSAVQDGGDSGVDGWVCSCCPATCESLGVECGVVGDGCGSALDCGSCTSPEICGGDGMPNVCGWGGICTPRSCAEGGFNCGPVSDGCGGVLECGPCPVGEVCGAEEDGVCGVADGGHP